MITVNFVSKVLLLAVLISGYFILSYAYRLNKKSSFKKTKDNDEIIKVNEDDIKIICK